MKTVHLFEEYLRELHVLEFGEMQSLHADMICEIGRDPDALELYDDLVSAATKYAQIRAQWPLLTREEKMDRDSGRTSSHNSVITHCNMLARYLRRQGKKAQWRDRLGYEEEDPYFRKTIGDFGCYIVFVNSLCAR